MGLSAALFRSLLSIDSVDLPSSPVVTLLSRDRLIIDGVGTSNWIY
jgi:hypothetical protein